MESGFEKLLVYKKSFALAMRIFELTKKFPKEECYSLTDQIRRSSRSVASNIAEGYRKRIYPKHFISKMTDADSECSETIVWLNFAKECKYLEGQICSELKSEYYQVSNLLNDMVRNPEKYAPFKKSAYSEKSAMTSDSRLMTPD